MATTGRDPFHRCACVPSPYRTEREREASRLNRSGTRNHDRHAAAATRLSGCARPPSMTMRPKPNNARKYCEFHEQNRHTTTDEYKGQISRFLKKGPRFLRREREPTQPQSPDEECSTEVVTAITGGYDEGYDLISLEGSAQRHTAGRDIVPLVHPILGFKGQEVNPIDMIRLPLRFGDELKARNLEVALLAVDVPTIYNFILGRPTLHKLALQLLLLGLLSIFLLLQLLPAPLVPDHQPLQPSALRRGLYLSSKSLSHSHLFLGDLMRLRSARNS
ncbi:hypothetical protein Cgig2_015617 [Carnegiea gigantea]|uniref:Uncharacterized protein n=1 Tax=Carnegiea gigantea TaxID=171969 RepID=A0A9Q1GZD8_9CARY|nr:hypothetical protein Cgig2_015617 [Carnegiea gigantea]